MFHRSRNRLPIVDVQNERDPVGGGAERQSVWTEHRTAGPSVFGDGQREGPMSKSADDPVRNDMIGRTLAQRSSEIGQSRGRFICSKRKFGALNRELCYR